MVVDSDGRGGLALAGGEYREELLVLGAVAFGGKICVGSVVGGHALGVTSPSEW